MSFALVLKKTSWYRRRYSRPLRVKVIFIGNETSDFTGGFNKQLCLGCFVLFYNLAGISFITIGVYYKLTLGLSLIALIGR